MSAKLSDIIGPKVFVVAEVGKGFIQTEEDQTPEVYLENAKELVRLAKEAGADAVKFQTHTFDDEQANINVVSPHFRGADRYNWVKRNTEAAPLWFWRELKKYCGEIGIVFFSTPMSRGAARLLNQVGVDLWKIGSGDLLDFVMLDYVASTKKPIIISAGMSTLEEVDLAVDFLKRRRAEFALMHCVSKYPCPPEDLQLQTIKFFRDRYNIPIGFSDHSIGIDSAVAAAALGATIIEKHFSLSRDLWGSDHKVALTPDELKSLVVGIREVESSPDKKKEYLNKEVVRAGLGQPIKTLQEGEAEFRPFFRKTLVALRDIPASTAITAEMIGAMRPQAHLTGLPSEKYEAVVGRTLLRAVKKYEPIGSESLSHEVMGRPVQDRSRTVRSFIDLIVWQKSHQLMLDCYKFSELLPKEEKYNRISQLKRSSSSTPSNIAEGFGRYHFQENIQFCRQARGSLAETANHITAARDLGQAPPDQCDKLLNRCEEARILLNSYIRSIKNSKDTHGS